MYVRTYVCTVYILNACTVCTYALYTTAGRPLFYIGLHLLQKNGLIDFFKLDILRVMKFLCEFTHTHTHLHYRKSALCLHNINYISCHCVLNVAKIYVHLPIPSFVSDVVAMAKGVNCRTCRPRKSSSATKLVCSWWRLSWSKPSTINLSCHCYENCSASREQVLLP